ncbi:hypothetical protein GY45DRAFT_1332171 [Cubamyces sp. BRFM 1775]|nr:hypothetical protein GY45DRAFT_1332171 [Cubamyces sp. BRFM 1775]
MSPWVSAEVEPRACQKKHRSTRSSVGPDVTPDDLPTDPIPAVNVLSTRYRRKVQKVSYLTKLPFARLRRDAETPVGYSATPCRTRRARSPPQFPTHVTEGPTPSDEKKEKLHAGGHETTTKAIEACAEWCKTTLLQARSLACRTRGGRPGVS